MISVLERLGTRLEEDASAADAFLEELKSAADRKLVLFIVVCMLDRPLGSDCLMVRNEIDA